MKKCHLSCLQCSNLEPNELINRLAVFIVNNYMAKSPYILPIVAADSSFRSSALGLNAEVRVAEKGKNCSLDRTVIIKAEINQSLN